MKYMCWMCANILKFFSVLQYETTLLEKCMELTVITER